MSSYNVLNSFPERPHDAETERELFLRYRKTGDEKILEELVLANMRIAVAYARKVCKEHFGDDELVSVCWKTLLRIAKRYKPQGKRFFDFAKIGVRGDVHRHFRTLDTVNNAHKANPVPWTDEPQPLEPDIAPSGFESVASHDDWKYVQKVIARCCTVRERLIFALTYEGDLKFNRTARLLGLTRAAIQAAHAKAVRKVRNEIARQERLLRDENSCA